MTRSIEALVEEQAHRWQLVRAERREEPRRPEVTVSRQHGAGGAEVARTLAAQLGLDLFTPAALPVEVAAQPVYLGSYDGTAGFWDGWISHIRSTPLLLTDAEIARLP